MPADDLRSPETKNIDAEIARAVARERQRCWKIAETIRLKPELDALDDQSLQDTWELACERIEDAILQINK